MTRSSPCPGPDVISLQVRDVERSAMFHEEHLGPTRQEGPPHAVASATKPIDLDGYQVTLHDRA